MKYQDLAWVDTFIGNVKSYIFVRLEDNLLIKRPNNATKLNPMGARILYSLLKGKSIEHLLDQIGREPEKITAVANFLWAVKQNLEGSLDEFSINPAVETVPFEMNFSQYPVLSEVAVTYRCNLKCRFCYAGCNAAENPIHSSREMTSREIKKVLYKLFYQAKVPSVSFTGGEPLLLPQLPKLIRYAKKLGMRVNLITNGTLVTEKMAQTLADNGLDSAQVSLEGITPGTHDAVVRSKGAFQKTILAVKRLKEKGILTHTNTTITKANLHECEAFPAFIKKELNNDKFSMNLVIPTGTSALHSEILVKYSEIGCHLEKIIKKSEEQEVEFMWYSPVPMCMFNSITHSLGNKGCSACDGLISIAPNGEVLPCASFADPVGNFLQQEFTSIWQSLNAKKYREKSLAHPRCQRCEHFHICNGACPIYWQHMGFDELTTLPPAARWPHGMGDLFRPSAIEKASLNEPIRQGMQ
ncbi:MAG: radical SAM protein [Candidatus Aminicenantes bacterium]|jgi:radical SAM protein with 4Fe4S-binding SPASM domain